MTSCSSSTRTSSRTSARCPGSSGACAASLADPKKCRRPRPEGRGRPSLRAAVRDSAARHVLAVLGDLVLLVGEDAVLAGAAGHGLDDAILRRDLVVAGAAGRRVLAR